MKPFLICGPDGYIIDIYCPFPATWNDATILKKIMKEDDDPKKLLFDGDYFVLDRGFRNALKTLKDKYNLETMMPYFLSRDRKQFTAKEANDSRLCTKLRWVVEVMNGLIKARYRLYDHIIEPYNIYTILNNNNNKGGAEAAWNFSCSFQLPFNSASFFLFIY